MSPLTSKLNPLIRKAQVLLVLALDKPALSGTRPSLLDIDLFRRGHLPKKRLNEVKAFIARDPECYQMWRDLIAAERLVPQRSQSEHTVFNRQKWWTWLQPKPVFAGSFVAALSIVLMVIQFYGLPKPTLEQSITDDYLAFSESPNPSMWWPESTSKSLPFVIPTPYQQAKKAVRAGFRRGLETLLQQSRLSDDWQTVILSYPEQMPPCSKDQNTLCQQRQQILSNLGYWLTLAHLECQQPNQTDDSNYLQKQQIRVKYFQEQLNPYPDLQPLNLLLNRPSNWQNRADFCQTMTSLFYELND